MSREFSEFIIGEGAEFNSDLNVPFVPTDEVIVESMLDLARVTAQDVLYDLGSGDGRIVVAAAMGREARAVGVDMDPPRLEEAREFAASMGMDHLVEFIEDDFFTVDISRATVVTLYLLQSINLLLRPRLLTELKPGTRVVSHSFDMGDWLPDDRCYAAGAHIYQWVVPANVAGVWQWQAGDQQHFSVALTQKFQQLNAQAWLNEEPIAVEAASLRGNRLTLTLQGEDADTTRTFNWRLKEGQLQPRANETGFTRATRL
ncbi:methyltransferase domain-containing protein [Oceanisphaera sp.]|uniref:methyltransferase domain-containing protein n=1 Tax=Oceanisphaera sp. TaxID=1929979 RepID=UPI003A8FA95C